MTAPYNYTTLIGAKSLTGSIKYWVNHDTIDPEQILLEAQQHLYARMRTREMLVSATITATLDQEYVTLPAGFQDPLSLRMHGDSEDLEYVHENLIDRIYNEDGTLDSGTPDKWSIWDERIQFDVPPDDSAVLTGKLIYYGTPAALAAGNTTNFLTDRYATLLRRACLVYGYEARNRRDLMEIELRLVEMAIDEANRLADMSRRGQTLRR